MSDLDWSTPTPRDPNPAQQAVNGCSLARQGGVNSGAPRPSFEHLTGEVIWRTYPGHKWLTIAEADDLALLISEEWTRNRMGGGGPCEAVSMLMELNTAIKAATRWRQAAQGN